MKKLLLITLLIASCKKNDKQPDVPAPPVNAAPACTTYTPMMAGRYVSSDNDTILIKFLSDNCPTSYSNKYQIDGLNNLHPGLDSSCVAVSAETSSYVYINERHYDINWIRVDSSITVRSTTYNVPTRPFKRK